MASTILPRLSIALFVLIVFSAGGSPASDEEPNAKGRSLLAALAKRYGEASSYSGVAKAKAVGVFTGPEEVVEATTTIAFARDGDEVRFKLEGVGGLGDSTAVYDGSALFAYYGPLNAYTKTEGAQARQMAREVKLGPMGGLVVELLRSEGRIEALCAAPDSIEWLRSESVDERPTDVVTFATRGRGTATIWIDGEGRMLKETYDLMPVLRERAASSLNAKPLPEAAKRIGESQLAVTIVHETIELDKPIPPEKIRFEPPAAAKLVAEFDESAVVPDWARMTRRLVGKPIPEVSGKTLSGEMWSTRNLKGTSTILYFAAPWLPQSVKDAEALARMVEEGERRLIIIAEDPVEAFRAAFDRLQGPGRVLAVRDAEGLIAQRCEILGIPAALVLDADGVVRAQCGGSDVVEAVGRALERIGSGGEPR